MGVLRWGRQGGLHPSVSCYCSCCPDVVGASLGGGPGGRRSDIERVTVLHQSLDLGFGPSEKSVRVMTNCLLVSFSIPACWFRPVTRYAMQSLSRETITIAIRHNVCLSKDFLDFWQVFGRFAMYMTFFLLLR